MSPAFNLINQYHKRIFHLIIIFCTAIFLLVLIVIFSPLKVLPAQSPIEHRLDGNITVTVLGFVDNKSLTVSVEPEIPVKVVWKNTLIPFIQQLEVRPEGLLKASSNYSVNVGLKNLYGSNSISKINLQTESLPNVISASPPTNKQNVPSDSEIEFTMNKSYNAASYDFLAEPDFFYEIRQEGPKIFIKPTKRLLQGQIYKIYLLLRLANSDFELLYSGGFSVISPLTLTTSAPVNGAQTVLKQSSLKLTFDKAVEKQTWSKSFDIDPKTEGKFSWEDGKTVVFTPTSPWLTNTTFLIKILSNFLEGADGSRLNSDVLINFKTAGPVSVINFSPGGGLVGLNSEIRVTFNQPVEALSGQEKYSVSPSITGSFRWEGNTLIFKPQGLSLLTTYKVSIATGIKSIGGEDSVEAYSRTFTTTSERTRTIGYSVRGRPLYASYFGVGPKKILLVGTLHGIESNTGVLLSSWINYLRANQPSIGSDRTFIVVSYANPDGKAANNRFNSNGVDLNRNWGSSTWQSLSYWNTSSIPNGGGTTPFSEPETQALRNLMLAERPSRVITYHAAINTVIGGSIADAFADWYSAQTGYPKASGGEETFGYPVTGTFEEWANENGMMTILVELASAYSSEYDRNLPALKGLLTLSM